MYICKNKLLGLIGTNAERQIMEHFYHYDIIDLRRTYHNPFRVDKNPGCNFKWYNGRFIFFDTANINTSFDCFKLVQLQYGCSFNVALSIIAKAFDIDIQYAMDLTKPVEINNTDLNVKDVDIKRNIQLELKRRNEFQVITRPWTTKDMAYWKSYGIKKDTLSKYNVYPVSVGMISTATNMFRKIYDSKIDNDPCYLYLFNNDIDNIKFSCVKLYRPLGPKNVKWFSNTSKHEVFGYSCLPEKGKMLIIASSAKDSMVLHELGYTSIAFQNEAVLPSKLIIDELKSRFKLIIYIYDLDKAGLKNSVRMAQETKCKVRFLPKINTFDKDIAEYYQTLGLDVLKKILKTILH